MIFTQLTLTDFGVFRGQQTIRLTPHPKRPIVLFGGKNGAGKSTLLEAIRLCLYGQRAFNEPISKDTYRDYLDSRIHSNSGLLIQPIFASVALEFQYGEGGQIHVYRVTRSWERRGLQKLQEYLEITRDNEILEEVSEEYWQDFLRDLVPPGISQFFFFDGEKIQQLAEDTPDQLTLAESIKSLLGLDLVDRLHNDIGHFISRQTKPSLSKEAIAPLEAIEEQITPLENALKQSQAIRAQAGEQLAQTRQAIQKVESNIASAGGTFAKNRERLIQKQATLKAAISHQEGMLRQHCAGLLPFTLAQKTCLILREQLKQEEQAAEVQSGLSFLEKAKKELASRVGAPAFWTAFNDIPTATKTKIRRNVLEAIRQPLAVEQAQRPPNFQVVHPIATPERRKLLSWISQVTKDLPKETALVAKELETHHRELEKVESHIRKIPADALLKPLIAELRELQNQLTENNKKILALDQEVRAKELELADLQRRHTKTVELLTAQISTRERVALASNVQNVLHEYKTTLLEKKVGELEDAVSQCFNRLCRKKDALRRISIDPKNFSVTLLDRQERPLPKAQLSAGEKQIFAVSMLWALGKVSGRPLPIIIDTPLARLDSDHRKLLVREYFPAASQQMIILSTDTEIDQSYFTELRPKIAQAYSLEFDQTDQCTKISKGYWWNGAHETH